MPSDNKKAKKLLKKKTKLPKSLDGGWKLPDASGIKLYLSDGSSLGKGHKSGPGFREYDGGEAGTHTVMQQLPGKNVRLYKVITEHAGPANKPTVLRLRFSMGECSGAWIFKQCAPNDWILNDRYAYLGTRGVALMSPDDSPDGNPVGFLSAPVVHDANGHPVYTAWRLDGRTVVITVYDQGRAHPVVVDPHWFVGKWLLAVEPLRVGGCVARIILDWYDTAGQAWYRRVWHAALECLASF